jgi:hypothetical protein
MLAPAAIPERKEDIMEKITMYFTTDCKRQSSFKVCGQIKFAQDAQKTTCYYLYDINGNVDHSVYPLGIDAVGLDNTKYSLFATFNGNEIVAYKNPQEV